MFIKTNSGLINAEHIVSVEIYGDETLQFRMVNGQIKYGKYTLDTFKETISNGALLDTG